jgi:hypothetical protein
VLILLAYLSVVGLAIAAGFIMAVVALARVTAGRTWPLVAAGVLLVAGTIPPTLAALLWYARSADYVWAIRGPGVFAQLGGGPATVAATVLILIWTSVTWIAAIRLAARRPDPK